MTETTVTLGTTLTARAPLKRAAIIGTAQSWRACPWADATLEKWTLNDGYRLGYPHSDRHYDLHPFHQMVFLPPQAQGSSGSMSDIPTGAYLRPEGHLEWLRTRTFPGYLAQARADFPTGRAFPRQAILDAFAPFWPWRLTRKQRIEPGPDYEVSTPSWMLMHAIVEGYQEIHVYGIHLATQWEYVEQRPNFEWLLGLAAGKGVRVVLPESTPICRAQYRYAFEPKADLSLQAANRTIGLIKAEGLRLRQQLVKVKWYAVGQRMDIETRLAHLDVELMDARQTMQRLSVTLAA